MESTTWPSCVPASVMTVSFQERLALNPSALRLEDHSPVSVRAPHLVRIGEGRLAQRLRIAQFVSIASFSTEK